MPALSGSAVAYTYAQSNVMRAGTSRSNFTSPKVFVSINGTHYATGRDVDGERVLQDTLTIARSSDDTPDTCVFKMLGAKPSPGQSIVITLGSKNTFERLFAGSVLSVTVAFEQSFALPVYEVRGIDWSWHLTRRLVSKLYASESASDIAADLLVDTLAFIPSGTNWNSSAPYIESGLPVLDSFSVTNETVLNALRRLAKRVGCYLDVDYHRRIRFASTQAQGTNPTTIDTSHASVRDLTFQKDNSQIVTSVSSEGGGSAALTTVAAGETVLPVTDASWYNTAGGIVRAGYDAVAYAGVDLGNGGARVGLPSAPKDAVSVDRLAGAGITAGDHYWAYTFVTGAGESLPSPVSSTITMGTIAAPGALSSATVFSAGTGPAAGVSVSYAMTLSIDAARANETALGPATTVTGNGHLILLQWEFTAAMLGLVWTIYRDDNGGGYKLLYQDTVQFVGTGVLSDTNITLGTSGPVSTGATAGQAGLRGVARGPSGTTSRNVYRTAAGGSQLKLVAAIANNTATTYTDSTADGALGANAPVTDTSGLSTATGTVSAGATSLELASSVAFNTAGGWAVIGNGTNVIRYTGISGNSLTGIPASGAGAIAVAIDYGSTCTAAPALTGISSSVITSAIPIGTPINVLCSVFYLADAGTLASAIGNWPITDAGGVNVVASTFEDGVVEAYIVDNRLSEHEALVRAYATAELLSEALVSVSWSSRDLNTSPGRTVTLDLASTDAWLTGSYTIQTVTISNFQTAMYPTFHAEASGLRFSFEDLVRQERTA